ncbi:RNA polymerase sigma-70 factor, ECF subfamily [Virgibacillus subterraneus]|uniref:RNA polymerase sigma-70 factor, ECF subfamily n=1 Tax=Virgibacillus subterraneus TaxID=621109 RepID=A0A1H8ZHI0_9BACI|nr:sigma-70 family RNA polymerase sigma factor [Virgibacillus subterraneus]SEP63775.1 RNA polymerase sigma-70 factor, ECF subfamily [Virgibacillus subterraneus]
MGHSKAFHLPYKKDDQDIIQMNPAEAIAEIMDLYGDEIKRLIYTYVKNNADTDDVTQEVFMTIYQKLSTFQGKLTLKSWVYSIAINKSKDHLRSWRSRNKRLKEKLSQSARFLEISDETPEEYMIRENESSDLLDKVMNLPIKYREVIILYYFKELSAREISYALNMKEVSVRTRLIRGREKLKQVLSLERGVNHG